MLRPDRFVARLVACLLIALGGAAPFVPAAHGNEAIDGLFAKIALDGTNVARFHELRRMRDLDVPVESTGELRFEPPDLLEKRTIKPVEETLRLRGDRLSITMSGSTRELPLDAAPPAAALATAMRGLLAGRRSEVERHFSMSLEQVGTAWTLRLLPRDSSVANAIAGIDIQGDQRSMTDILIRQTNGDESQMHIITAP